MLRSAPIFYWSKIPRIVSCHRTAWFQSATARREGSWCSLLRCSWCFVYHRQAAAKVLKNECMSLQVVIINIAKITYQFKLYPKSCVMVLWLGGGAVLFPSFRSSTAYGKLTWQRSTRWRARKEDTIQNGIKWKWADQKVLRPLYILSYTQVLIVNFKVVYAVIKLELAWAWFQNSRLV